MFEVRKGKLVWRFYSKPAARYFADKVGGTMRKVY